MPGKKNHKRGNRDGSQMEESKKPQSPVENSAGDDTVAALQSGGPRLAAAVKALQRCRSQQGGSGQPGVEPIWEMATQRARDWGQAHVADMIQKFSDTVLKQCKAPRMRDMQRISAGAVRDPKSNQITAPISIEEEVPVEELNSDTYAEWRNGVGAAVAGYDPVDEIADFVTTHDTRVMTARRALRRLSDTGLMLVVKMRTPPQAAPTTGSSGSTASKAQADGASAGGIAVVMALCLLS
jgi:hypothetical protein